ncbi:hypothetical protein RI054_06g32530 [Pseudoscourfieldia marina]
MACGRRFVSTAVVAQRGHLTTTLRVRSCHLPSCSSLSANARANERACVADVSQMTATT